MKKGVIIAALICALTTANGQERKAIFIIIDGVSKDVLEKVSTPNLDAIAQEGGLLSAYQGGELNGYSQTPTISAPGYNNVLTGVWFNKHNVRDNSIKAPNYNYPTIFRLFEDQFPGKQTAVFSSWQDNRTKLIGEGLAQTGNIRLDHYFDGLELDTVKYPHDKARKFMSVIDQAVTDDAVRSIRQNAPDLSWVYLEFTDDMGHAFGDSEQYFDAVKQGDRQIGQIWAVIKERKEKFNEDWLIIVTTDHGRDAASGKNHGGQSERERASWIITNANPLSKHAIQTNLVSVVDILPTIARFLKVKLSSERQGELDGVALIGKVSLTQPVATKNAGEITLSWLPLEKKGKIKVWLSETNNYKLSGESDKYRRAGVVPVKEGKFTIDLGPEACSNFYKIVLEGKYNSVNRWILTK